VKFKLPAQEEVGFQMAPLIDMVFLLLIFFMCASNLQQLDRPQIEIPLAKNAQISEDLSGRCTITIKQDETVWLGNITVGSLGEGGESALLERLDEYVGQIRQRIPDLKVNLRADKRLKHKQVRKVMTACARVGITDIIFATYQSDK